MNRMQLEDSKMLAEVKFARFWSRFQQEFNADFGAVVLGMALRAAGPDAIEKIDPEDKEFVKRVVGLTTGGHGGTS